MCRCRVTTTATATTGIAVFRNGVWYVKGQALQMWGQAGDVPVPGDYDGNGTTGIAVFRNGEWYVKDQPPFPQCGGRRVMCRCRVTTTATGRRISRCSVTVSGM